MSRTWTLAIVGATDTVGNEILRVMEERDLPIGELRLFSTDRYEEDFLEFGGDEIMVQAISTDSFLGVDVAFFAEGQESSRKYCPVAASSGAVCIDTTGSWSMDPDIPLVVPEINPADISRFAEKRIIAIPNSSTIPVVVALKPLHDYARIRRVVVATYQPVSRSGRGGVDELRIQAGELLNGRPVEARVFPHQIGFNCLPHIGPFQDNGCSWEEMQLMEETSWVLGDADIGVTATAVQVPVFFGHGAAVNIETERKVSVPKARALLEKASGIRLVDAPSMASYPTPLEASGQDSVLVGRIREDVSIANGLNIWLCADNLRKGAATSAVQIAGILIDEYLQDVGSG